MNHATAQPGYRMTAAKLLLLLFVVLMPGAGHAAPPDDKFVRTANYYLRAGTDINPGVVEELSKYDLLVLLVEMQQYNRADLMRLRELNPDIILLAYVPSKSINYSWSDQVHQRLVSGIDPSWYLRSANGAQVSVWPGTAVVSTVSGWQNYLPQFVHDELWSSGLWDGVFYDEFSSNASWMNGGDIDLQRDGARDDARLADVAWERATVNLLRNTRQLLGPNAVIVTNGDSTDSLQPYVNGRMFETFPTPWEGQGRWMDTMYNYLRLHSKVGYPPTFIINTNTGNTGDNADYRKMRYGLTSALMSNGYSSFDFGDQNHGQLWQYDEYGIHLGRPLGDAVNQFSPTDRSVLPSVWRRDFTNGVALVNATDSAQRITFDAELERITGTQDPQQNSGGLVTSLTLQPRDGILLLKPLETITGGAFPNGAFARLYDQNGNRVRNGFFAYVPPYDGAAQIAIRDLDDDGRDERIVAGKTVVTIYNENGTVRTSFKPYGDAYALGINFGVGDLEGDGTVEIVTGTGPGGGPQVRVFNMDGVLINPGFFAYDPRFRGGVQIALGDIYGNGHDVIVAGAGFGGGPHVRVFTKGGRVLNQFFAYDPAFRGGVRVAVGDVDGDKVADIVTGAGKTGGPHVRVFTATGRLKKQFFSGDVNARNGVEVAVTDTDHDGIYEIATLTTDVFQLSTR